MVGGIEAMRLAGAPWPRAGAAPAEGFRVPAPAAPGTMARAAAMAPISALSATMPSARDVAARRRATGLLNGLSALQREMLGARHDAAALAKLPGLVDGEDGEDPALVELLQAMALRARIEMLRRDRSR